MSRDSDVPLRIVRAATASFSREGYHGTHTSDIARLADVSEVTLYRYFECKEDVFWCALEACFDTIKSRLGALEPYSKNAAPGVMLPKILSVLVDAATFSPELVRMVAIALFEVRGSAEEICRKHMTPLFMTIANYLENNMEAGSIRRLNSTIMTLGIALTVFAQPEISKLIEGSRFSKLDTREVVERYSEFWLGVLLQPVP
jgi:AcrR family transcriptional regulator